MNKYLFTWTLGLMLLGSSQLASADPSYWSLQYSQVSYEVDGADSIDPSALVLRFGGAANNYFSLEGRVGLGVQDDSVDLGGGNDFELRVNYLVGVYGVFHTDIYNSAQLYGIVGFSQVELEAEAFGLSDSSAESGASYGIGANLGPLNVEYMLYLNDDFYDLSAISIGYYAQFD